MVFGHFIQFGSSDWAENPYLDRLDHYLQLFNWLHVQENSSWPFFWPKMAIFGHFSDFKFDKKGKLTVDYIKHSDFHLNIVLLDLWGNPPRVP